MLLQAFYLCLYLLGAIVTPFTIVQAYRARSWRDLWVAAVGGTFLIAAAVIGAIKGDLP